MNEKYWIERNESIEWKWMKSNEWWGMKELNWKEWKYYVARNESIEWKWMKVLNGNKWKVLNGKEWKVLNGNEWKVLNGNEWKYWMEMNESIKWNELIGLSWCIRELV